MYKTRIKRWGLSKYLGPDDIPTLLRGRVRQSNDGGPATVLIRGRHVDQDKMQRYLRQAGLGELLRRNEYNKAKANNPFANIAAPNPRWVKGPDVLRLPEEIMLLSSQLAAGSYEQGIWAPNKDDKLIFATENLIEWDHKVGTGRLLMGKDGFKEAFQILDAAFAMLESLVVSYDPVLFIYVILNSLMIEPDIGQRLLSYVADMSRTKLGDGHPMTTIWNKLSKVGVREVKRSAWPMLLAYLNTLSHLFGRYQKDLLYIVYWLYNDAYFAGLLGGEDCQSMMKTIIDQSMALNQRADTLQAKQILVEVLTKEKKYDEAMRALEELIAENHREGETVNKGVEETCYRLRFIIPHKAQRVQQALEAGRECVQFLRDTRGPDYSSTILVAAEVRVFLEDNGIVPDDALKELVAYRPRPDPPSS